MPRAADRKRQEERVKLGASALANLGTAFIVGGAVGPALLGRLNGLVGVVSILVGLVFHGAAHAALHYVVADAIEEELA